jgi:hypothetical protein
VIDGGGRCRDPSFDPIIKTPREGFVSRIREPLFKLVAATFFPREIDAMIMIAERFDHLIETTRAPGDQDENMTPIRADRVRRGVESASGCRRHGMEIDRFVRVFSRRRYAMRVINMQVPPLWNKHFKSRRGFHGRDI